MSIPFNKRIWWISFLGLFIPLVAVPVALLVLPKAAIPAPVWGILWYWVALIAPFWGPGYLLSKWSIHLACVFYTVLSLGFALAATAIHGWLTKAR